MQRDFLLTIIVILILIIFYITHVVLNKESKLKEMEETYTPQGKPSSSASDNMPGICSQSFRNGMSLRMGILPPSAHFAPPCEYER